jgi:DNA-directed RNA polymerase specialized sigma24 family protein
MDDDARELDELVERWQTGYGDVRSLYESLREGMHQTARRGIQRVIARPPDEHRVSDVVYTAFVELLRGDPAAMTSPVGLAKTIAYRRGIDEGRRILRERQRISSLDALEVATTMPDKPGILAAAEEEALHQLVATCMEFLTTDQRAVVRATVMGSQTLSDWALTVGTSHQAVSRQRSRALDALRRCVRRQRTAAGGRETSRGRRS